jgi:potassium/hydrogen antiporter
MTYYLLIALCIIIIIAYVIEITGNRTRIPGVILLIFTGIGINYFLAYLNIQIPDLSGLLPMMGTIGLILIVLEGSLDLTISARKKHIIITSVSSAIILFLAFVSISTLFLVKILNFPLVISLINTIPLGVISSAVAIPSASRLHNESREFVIYESSISDIIGILVFDLILYNYTSIGKGILGFTLDLIITIIASMLLSTGLAILLHKISHHVKYVIITAVIVLVYSLARLVHMPSLVVVLIFGLVMNNSHLFKNSYSQKFVDFGNFINDLKSFKHITGEFTFVVRSFFFVMFGYYTSVSDLFNLRNILSAIGISAFIFILRALYLKLVLRMPQKPLVFFAPRGLITILLFLSIPVDQLLPFMNKGLVTQVIFISILLMSFGNILFNGKSSKMSPLSQIS